MQKPMAWVLSALALSACEQSGAAADQLSTHGLSTSPGSRRAEQPGSIVGSVASSASELGIPDRACDAGAARSGSSAAEPRTPRNAQHEDHAQAAAGSGGEHSRAAAGSGSARSLAAGSGGDHAQVAAAGGGSSATAGDARHTRHKRNGGRGGAGGRSAEPSSPIDAGTPPHEPVEPAASNAPPAHDVPNTSSSQFHPAPGTSWQIQLTGNIDTSVAAEVFDLDLFETSAADIDKLHKAGRRVICYFDTAYESYRPDSKLLEPYRGNPIEGWPGQYWIDIRQPAVLDVMSSRITLAQTKGCDAVDADDVDARSNHPGFPIGAADQQTFVRQLSAAAHARGLAFGLKNDLEDLPALITSVDFAVNEECFVYDECDSLKPVIAAGKPVFQIEYADGSLESRASEICPKAAALGFDTIIKHQELDAARRSCR